MHGYRAVLVLGGLWLAACGSVSKEDFDGKLAEALCERYVRCGMYLDEESCAREMTHRVLPPYGLGQKYDTALSEGRTRYDAGAAAQCLEKIRSGSCDEGPVSSRVMRLGFGLTEECRFLIGDGHDGDPCESTADCGSDSFCTSAVDGHCGGACKPWIQKGESFDPYYHAWCASGLVPGDTTCEEPVIVGEGQRCTDPSSRCGPGLYCTSDYVCRRFGAEGEACSPEDPSGILCAWTLACVDGTCRKRGGEGTECPGVSANMAAANGALVACMRDFFCDADPDARGKCRALLTEGGSCRGSQECAADLYCVGASASTSTRGTCQRRSTQVGEVCDVSQECASPAVCYGHICSPYTACGGPGRP